MSMTTSIERFTQWARDNPQRRYTSLMGLLSNPVDLLDCFEEQPGNKAVGIDGVSKAEYAVDVVERIRALSQKIAKPKLSTKTGATGVYSEKRRQIQTPRHTKL